MLQSRDRPSDSPGLCTEPQYPRSVSEVNFPSPLVRENVKGLLEAPRVREYAARRLSNTVGIGHELGAQYAFYWPGLLGYYVQGASKRRRRCAGLPMA